MSIFRKAHCRLHDKCYFNPMWSDNETDQDLLGFDVHADLIKTIVTDNSNLPVTVGLFGDWGSGKSSILKILKNGLSSAESKKKHLVIHFDSWIFEGYEDAKTAILTAIIDELASNATLGARVKGEALSLLKRVRWMKIAKIGIQAAASIALSNPLPLVGGMLLTKGEAADNVSPNGFLSDLIDPENGTAYDVRKFREEFGSLLEKTGLDSLIVLVDDLDRCSPERIIENLEAIKLFLNVPGMAFVIAADRRIVEDAIRVRYANFLSSATLGAGERQAIVVDYLEKLIQIPYTLPKLSPIEVRHYLSLLLVKKIVPGKFEIVADDYQKFLVKNRYGRYDVYSKIGIAANDSNKSILDRYLNLVDSASDPITDGLKGNPRQVKRFLNALWLRQRLADVSSIEHIDHSVLIKLMVLEYVNLELFGQLYKLHKQSGDGRVSILSSLESGNDDELPDDDSKKKWKAPSIMRWLKAEPKLAEVDLRDYFWVSRSSLEDSLVGLRMLSQAARRCLDGFLSGAMPARTASGRLFSDLDEIEQGQVIADLQGRALQKPEEPFAAEALFHLADALGVYEAADALWIFYERSDMDRANIKLAHALASLENKHGNSANERLRYIRDSMRDKTGKFPTALKNALKPKKK